MELLRAPERVAAATLLLILACGCAQGTDSDPELFRGDISLPQELPSWNNNNDVIDGVRSEPSATRRKTGDISSRIKILAIAIVAGVGVFFIGAISCCYRRGKDSDWSSAATAASSAASNSCFVPIKRHGTFYPPSESNDGEIPVIILGGGVRRTDNFVIHASMPLV